MSAIVPSPTAPESLVDPRQSALKQYQKKLLEHREIEAKVKECRSFSLNLMSLPLVLISSNRVKLLLFSHLLSRFMWTFQ